MMHNNDDFESTDPTTKPYENIDLLLTLATVLLDHSYFKTQRNIVLCESIAPDGEVYNVPVSISAPPPDQVVPVVSTKLDITGNSKSQVPYGFQNVVPQTPISCDEIISDIAMTVEITTFKPLKLIPIEKPFTLHLKNATSLKFDEKRINLNSAPSSSNLSLCKKQGLPKQNIVTQYTCMICKKHFVNVDNFLAHLQEHIWDCPYCSKVYTSQNTLENHIEICAIAQKRFGLKVAQKFHNSNKTQQTVVGNRKFLCTICKKIFSSSHILKLHLQSHRNYTIKQIPTYECDLCMEKLSTKKLLVRHMAWHRNLTHNVCGMCNRTFVSFDHFEYHMNAHLTNKLKFKCKVCQKSYELAHELNKHMIGHNIKADYKCSMCVKEFHVECLYQQHLYEHTGIRHYKCTICIKDFHAEHLLKKHLKLHKVKQNVGTNVAIKPKVDGTNQLEVKVANEPEVKMTKQPEVKVGNQLDAKVTNKHENKVTIESKVKVTNQLEVKVANEPEVKVTKQPEVKEANQLDAKVTNKHENKVTIEPKVKVTNQLKVKVANEPEVKVTKQPDVNVTNKPEVKVTNKPEVKLANECDLCMRKCSTKKRLVRHLAWHRNLQRNVCKMCNRTFMSFDHFEYHMNAHLNNKLKFKCKVCPKSYELAHEVNKHISSHKLEADYKCSMCAREFHVECLYQQHLYEHTGIRHYKCTICSDEFHAEHLLKSHLKLHPKIEQNVRTYGEIKPKDKVTNESEVKLKVTKKTEVKLANKPEVKVTNKLEDKVTNQRDVHVTMESAVNVTELETNHIDSQLICDIIYKCEQCDQTFKRQALLKTHTSMVHTNNNVEKKPIEEHKCNLCDKICLSLTGLACHLKIHDQAVPLLCGCCNKIYWTKATLREHMRCHRDDNKKNAANSSFGQNEDNDKEKDEINISEDFESNCSENFVTKHNISDHSKTIEIETNELNTKIMSLPNVKSKNIQNNIVTNNNYRSKLRKRASDNDPKPNDTLSKQRKIVT